MLLTPEYQESEKTEKHITAILIKQWLYDSHLWVQVKGPKWNTRKCKWCQATSTLTSKVTGGQLFCPNNPIVEQIFNNIKKVIKETK
jgi:hypothetical protein